MATQFYHLLFLTPVRVWHAESRERSLQQYITELESQLADTISQHNEEVCPSPSTSLHQTTLTVVFSGFLASGVVYHTFH